ncbi:hypothetical protein Acr_06g0002930 [Actinidia rufa]|uniref:Uncharacterized protein n=1 Tax=Actinidia rufa TaxID=165716 RepID=A0A7J0EPI7_9ERIC|nr:hypothetical protein Acr_06g0002930 [Actinidia rufa]
MELVSQGKGFVLNESISIENQGFVELGFPETMGKSWIGKILVKDCFGSKVVREKFSTPITSTTNAFSEEKDFCSSGVESNSRDSSLIDLNLGRIADHRDGQDLSSYLPAKRVQACGSTLQNIKNVLFYVELRIKAVGVKSFACGIRAARSHGHPQKSVIEFQNEVSEILARHESNFDQIHNTLRTILAKLRALQTNLKTTDVNPFAPGDTPHHHHSSTPTVHPTFKSQTQETLDSHRVVLNILQVTMISVDGSLMCEFTLAELGGDDNLDGDCRSCILRVIKEW